MSGSQAHIEAIRALRRATGEPYSRPEMEQHLRVNLSPHDLRHISIQIYGLDRKHGFGMLPISVLHYVLDRLCQEGTAVGAQAGVVPGVDYDEAELRKFQQRLAELVQSGQALSPKEGDGVDMSTMNAFTPPPGGPQQPQQQGAFSPPQQGGFPPAQGQMPPGLVQQGGPPQGMPPGMMPPGAPQGFAGPPQGGPPQQMGGAQPGFAPPAGQMPQQGGPPGGFQQPPQGFPQPGGFQQPPQQMQPQGAPPGMMPPQGMQPQGGPAGFPQQQMQPQGMPGQMPQQGFPQQVPGGMMMPPQGPGQPGPQDAGKAPRGRKKDGAAQPQGAPAGFVPQGAPGGFMPQGQPGGFQPQPAPQPDYSAQLAELQSTLEDTSRRLKLTEFALSLILHVVTPNGLTQEGYNAIMQEGLAGALKFKNFPVPQ